MGATDDFFDRKKPWSWIKDNILASYLPAYFAKISRLNQPVLIIDAFAGAGKFDDGSPGSPLIIASKAREHLRVDYTAVFVNKDKSDHEKLASILQHFPNKDRLIAIQGDSQALLRRVADLFGQRISIFLYMDPFGMDFEFGNLLPFLNRNKESSTEILVNLNATGLHRLAGREKAKSSPDDERLLANQARLTRTLGGDYWKPYLLSDGLDTKERELGVVEGFKHQLESTNYLEYSCACPVLEYRGSPTKYYMVFASRHPDALVLMNEHMLSSVEKFLTEQEFQGTLFENMSWQEWRDTHDLGELVVQYVRQYPGLMRKQLWPKILIDHFMKFSESEYKKAVTKVFEAGRIQTPTARKTKRLNDECVLEPVETLF